MEPIPRSVDATRAAGTASARARMEARRLGHHYLGPEHLLLGLLRDAEDPVETDLAPQDRRQRVLLGLPDHGPHPIGLLVEASGLTLDRLRTDLLDELDQGQ
jgi:hypothetical protein